MVTNNQKWFIDIATKCYCATNMGKPDENEIMCKDDTGFNKAGNCNPDEWCIGPSNEMDASEFIDKLCAKGTI